MRRIAATLSGRLSFIASNSAEAATFCNGERISWFAMLRNLRFATLPCRFEHGVCFVDLAPLRRLLLLLLLDNAEHLPDEVGRVIDAAVALFAPAQAKLFETVLDQRALVDQVNAKTKAARRNVQPGKDAGNANIDMARPARSAVDCSKPVKPAKSELWDD